MKKNLFFLLLLGSLAVFFVTSCQKNEDSELTSNTITQDEKIETKLEFQKVLTVTDPLNENSVTVVIATDSKEISEKISAEMIVFTPYKVEDVEKLKAGEPGVEVPIDSENGEQTASEMEIEIHTISENLADGIIGYGLNVSNRLFNEALDDEHSASNRSCIYPTISSYADQPYNTIYVKNTTCETVLAKFCSKKYWFSLYSCNSTNGGERNLNVNQYWDFCRDNRYRLRARVKYNACCQQEPTFAKWIQYGGCN